MGVVMEAKKKVVLASVLKPVNDTRMTEKIAQSLAGSELFEVDVIGFPGDVRNRAGLTFHCLPSFQRISFQRLTMPWRILTLIFKLKPRLLIISTHELLFVSLIARWILRCRLVYDVQENYYRNIRYTAAFPFFIRTAVALYVRLKENICSPFIDHFFLAEKCYAAELPFVDRKFTILENKLKGTAQLSKVTRNKHQLLFSGTLAESTGVFKAIEIAEKLHRLDASFSLLIIGHCAKKQELEKIRRTIQPLSYIRLIGGDVLVPHDIILEQIHISGAGIVSYPPNKSTSGSIPTKLYEYLGMQLPIILTNHPAWAALCKPYPAACAFDPDSFDAAAVLKCLQSIPFYQIEPSDVFWHSEQPRLIAIVTRLTA
jgi:glycosyltransferase involved in cell wall biosynthesis